MAYYPSFTVGVAAACLSLIAILFKTWSGRPKGTLPGPRGRFLLGNMFDMPKTRQWDTFAAWKKIYGEVVGLNVLGKSIVILNSRKAVEDLFEKRSHIYSDRPRLTLLSTVCGFDWGLFFLPYGDEMNLQRRLMAQCFGKGVAGQFDDVLLKVSMDFARNLRDSPNHLREHTDLLVSSFILRVTYGYEVQSRHDQNIQLQEKLAAALADMGPAGTHMIDVFPVLSRLPPIIFGKAFVNKLRAVQRFTREIFETPFNQARERMHSQTSLRPSLTEILVESNIQKDGSINYERQIKALGAASYSAGHDTYHSTTETFFLMMMCHPEIQTKAQREIDALGRPPALKDRPVLPYLQAIMLEVLRWAPATPLSLPRRLLQDDMYEGMLLSQGSTVIPNTWGCLHDPTDYPHPEAFRPERFLTDDFTSLRDDIPDPRSFAFGYGKRVCPGRYIAENMVWITFATVLAYFRIAKPLDASGMEIHPDIEFNIEVVSLHAKPFQCAITPRSSEAMDTLAVVLEELKDIH